MRVQRRLSFPEGSAEVPVLEVRSATSAGYKTGVHTAPHGWEGSQRPPRPAPSQHLFPRRTNPLTQPPARVQSPGRPGPSRAPSAPQAGGGGPRTPTAPGPRGRPAPPAPPTGRAEREERPGGRAGGGRLRRALPGLGPARRVSPEERAAPGPTAVPLTLERERGGGGGGAAQRRALSFFFF